MDDFPLDSMEGFGLGADLEFESGGLFSGVVDLLKMSAMARVWRCKQEIVEHQVAIQEAQMDMFWGPVERKAQAIHDQNMRNEELRAKQLENANTQVEYKSNLLDYDFKENETKLMLEEDYEIPENKDGDI